MKTIKPLITFLFAVAVFQEDEKPYMINADFTGAFNVLMIAAARK